MPLFGPNLRDMFQKRDVDGLIKALDSEDTVTEAIDKLGSVALLVGNSQRTKIVNVLLRILATSPDWLQRSKAAQALGHTMDSQAIEGLAQALHDPNSMVVEHAAEALMKLIDHAGLRHPAVIDTLRQVAEHTNSTVRKLAVESLANSGDHRAVDALIQVLKDTDPTIRRLAAEGLAGAGDKRALEPLMEAIGKNSGAVQAAMAKALGRLGVGDRRAVKPLIAVLDSVYAPSRQAAAEALGRLGDPSAADALGALLKDPDPKVREAAHISLRAVEQWKELE